MVTDLEECYETKAYVPCYDMTRDYMGAGREGRACSVGAGKHSLRK